MTDSIDRLVLAEASFRADVISGLHREAQRLRLHHAIVDQQTGSHASLERLVSVVESVADKLREQDGHMARALGRWDGQHPSARQRSSTVVAT